MSDRLKYNRVLGNCVPAFLILENIAMHQRGNEGPVTGFEKAEAACREAIKGYVEECPRFYKDKAEEKARRIAKRLYFGYFEKQKFDTAKVFMTLHSWIHQLSDDGLIDIYSQDYLDTWEDLTEVYERGLEKGSEKSDGKIMTPEDIKKKYKSAAKHVDKLHDMAVEENLYITVEFVYV